MSYEQLHIALALAEAMHDLGGKGPSLADGPMFFFQRPRRYGIRTETQIVEQRASVILVTDRVHTFGSRRKPSAQPAMPNAPEAGRFGRNHSASFDHRRRPATLRTAMATAFFCPTSTTSFFPRVTPV